MIKTLFFFTAFLLAANLHADQVLTLKDGSQIKGDVTGMKDNVYTVKTSTLGEITVSGDQVANISNPEAAPEPTAAPTAAVPDINTSMNDKMQAAQAKIMNDPQVMAEMQTMLEDPEVAQLLADPALLQAVTSKDPAVIANNPKAQALMQNPKMKALIEKLQQK